MKSHIAIIKYRAIKLDNHQGGSGVPFEDKIVATIPSSMSIDGLDAHCDHLLKCLNDAPHITFIDNVDLISIEVVSNGS